MLRSGYECFHFIRDIEKIFVARARDLDRDSWSTVDFADGSDIVKLVANLADIADSEHDTVGLRDDRQLGYLLSDIPLVLSTEQNFLPVALDLAAWKLNVFTSQNVCNAI